MKSINYSVSVSDMLLKQQVVAKIEHLVRNDMSKMCKDPSS